MRDDPESQEREGTFEGLLAKSRQVSAHSRSPCIPRPQMACPPWGTHAQQSRSEPRRASTAGWAGVIGQVGVRGEGVPHRHVEGAGMTLYHPTKVDA